MKNIFIMVLIICLIFMIAPSYAHQPRIPQGTTIEVIDPEISKAYYHTLNGKQHTYTIASAVPFDLYINILVPYTQDQPKDVSFTLVDKNSGASRLFDGTSYERQKYFEPFGYDTYWKGPEYNAMTPAGEYEIIVSHPSNQSTYALAIGEAELFDISETINAFQLIPKIKREFFGYSPISFLLSPLGWGYVLIMLIISFIFGFVYRSILKIFAKKSTVRYSKNIDNTGRWIRAISGLVILLIAITTTWSPRLFFFSGFCFFESIFSWCGLNAALGKSSCPV